MSKYNQLDYEELNYAIDKIAHWYKKNIKFLNIITVPFNTSYIFSDIINEISMQGGKILYVWGNNRENRELLTLLREVNLEITYSYIDCGEGISNLTFVNEKNLGLIRGKYDLIIFDDIGYFSNIDNLNIRNKMDICSLLSHKIIFYGIEKISLNGEFIEISPYNYEKPFVEPRILTTRINLNTDIPYNLYEYLKWFVSMRKKVAIYTPDKEKLNLVYDYFETQLIMKGVKVIKVSEEDEFKRCSRVLKYKDKAIFIITDKVKELSEYCLVNDAVILFADDIRYTYKKFMYLCGKIGQINKELPEVLLVSNSISEDIDKAKELSREFNRKIWEKTSRK
ncbi:hypothetical protein NE172_11995 [Clostridium botulinum]|uniref:Comf operon protein A, DNA transporter ATPase n=1 Tax=Clostridium botulinum TaxID=1491 RepID=A0A6B4JNB4_CLOBO|nr:hypothetical protein [Clostridium botulinum]EES51198.1 conserved hypothetical protein [Clostridium botulinum E1 str. 'BoNT E Beluga']MBY6762076.1 hypothetical protein [Clostridium botulinum]MBY6920611.1 hypothetical protein [Clostridium botulinum]MCR1131673.1 hypothetical protein [Clostridium botulinum]NFJ58453.1 hypothetical protein [Clostridium botulinum]